MSAGKWEAVPSLSHEEMHQSSSWESVQNGHALKSVSNTSESAYIAVSSIGDKMHVQGK